MFPETEFWFHPDRKWRFDFAFPAFRVAIEIDGRGRHQTVTGVRGDLEKDRAALQRGWRVLHFPATDKAQALTWAREAGRLLRKIKPSWDDCAVCGCTNEDCSQCVEVTGEPCYWARPAVCSRCADRMRPQRRAPAGAGAPRRAARATKRA